jgi:hypothetical protein
LLYPKEYSGARLLDIKKTVNVNILLHQENFEIQWEDLKNFKNLKFSNTQKMMLFLTALLSIKGQKAN